MPYRTEREMKEEIEQEIAKNNFNRFLKPMCYFWCANLFWLLVMLWPIEFCKQELGMQWMETPQYYSIFACSITKFFLTITIFLNLKLIRD